MERLPLVAVIVSVRTPMMFALLGVLVLSLCLLAIRRARRVMAPLAVALVLSVAVTALPMFGRGSANESPAPLTSGELRILSWNINGDLVSPNTVARLAATSHADIVILPQTVPRQGDAYTRAFAASHLSMHRYSPAASPNRTEVTVFIAESLGTYRTVATKVSATGSLIQLAPNNVSLPTIVAVHAAQPTPKRTSDWDSDLRWVAAHCTANTIAVGDFNATLDNFGADQLGACHDAATNRGAANVGTWPTSLPPLIGIAIDHVLAAPEWKPSSFTVVASEDRSGALHRPVLAVVRRVSSEP